MVILSWLRLLPDRVVSVCQQPALNMEGNTEMATRRDVLQGLIVSVGGASALAACGGDATITSTSPGAASQFYSDEEMALVSRISDLIIPGTDHPVL